MQFFKRSTTPNYEDMDDKDLIQHAKNDRDAFGVLYERYAPKIYNYIYYRTTNHQDAEDLTARVFYRALNHIDNYVDRGLPFQAWLYRIAHNLVANFHRNQGRRKVIPLDDYVAHSLKSDSPDAKAEDNQEQERLMQAIEKLPAERQQLILLKFIEQKSNAEIGTIMGRTEGAIKSLYHRTLLALRDELQLQEANLTQDNPKKARRQRNG